MEFIAKHSDSSTMMWTILLPLSQIPMASSALAVQTGGLIGGRGTMEFFLVSLSTADPALLAVWMIGIGLLAGLTLFLAVLVVRRYMTALRVADQAILQLKASEQRLRTIYESEPECVKLVSPSGQLLDMNPAGLKLIEADSLAEVMNQSIYPIIDPKDLPLFRDMHQRVMRGETAKVEFEIVGLKGTRRLMESNASPLRDSSGKVIAQLAVSRDITDRNRAETALRESEALFRTLVETATFGILRHDLQGRVTFANAGMGRIHGQSPQELVGSDIWELAVDDNVCQQMREHVNQVLQTGRPLADSLETKSRTRDGRIIDVTIDWTVEQNAHGETVGFIMIMADISKKKESERALKFQVEVLNRVSDAVVVTGKDETITYANATALRLFQGGKPSYIGRRLSEVHDELLVSGAGSDVIRECLSKTGTWQGENEFHVDGETRWFETKLKTFQTPDCKDRFLLSVVRDISTRKRIELDSREHRDRLAHMTRLSTMGELLDGIAHEIKQPLYAITNFTTASSVVLSGLEPTADLSAEMLEELIQWNCGVRESSTRANEIIQRLREFAGKDEHVYEPCRADEILKGAVDMMAFEARRSQVRVETDIEAALPEIIVNRIQCEQVLVNLLRNAYEAVAGVDGMRRVVARAFKQEDSVEFQIVDSGPGIGSEQPGKLFQAFFTTKPGGMGMGLTISRTIVEDHEGHLWGTLNEHGGATFHVTFPCRKTNSMPVKEFA